MTFLEEKQSIDDFMRRIHLEPHHNVLYATKEFAPTLRQVLRFDEPATYEFFFTNTYLLIFTPETLVLKKMGKWSFYKNLEPQNLEKGLMKIPTSQIQDFSIQQVKEYEYWIYFVYQNKPYHFYVLVSEERKQISFTPTNFELLREQNFYGLLKKDHVAENPQAVQNARLKTFAMLYSVISFVAAFALKLPQDRLILGGGLGLLAAFTASFLAMDTKFPIFRWLVILLLAGSFGVYLLTIAGLL